MKYTSLTTEASSFSSSADPDLVPELRPEALHGLPGEIVRAIEPHTQASSAAVLIQFLIAFGNVVGRRPFMIADGSPHYPLLAAVLVGATARGSKGSSWAHVKTLFERVDPEWVRHHIVAGCGSGEALIRIAANGDGLRPDSDDNVGDGGDFRYLYVEQEYSKLMKVSGRDGSILSEVVRDGWDGQTLQAHVAKRSIVANDPCLSFIGHITHEELTQQVKGKGAVAIHNGSANRNLWVMVNQSKRLPHGGSVPDDELEALAATVRDRVRKAQGIAQMHRSERANDLWEQWYLALPDPVGNYGKVTSRAEAQVLRLSMVFALADGSDCISAEHLMAALAVWAYADESARHIFDDGTPNGLSEDARTMLQALTKSGGSGLARTQQSQLFSGKRSAQQLDNIRDELVAASLAYTDRLPSGGRSANVLYAAQSLPTAEEEKELQTDDDLTSLFIHTFDATEITNE